MSKPSRTVSRDETRARAFRRRTGRLLDAATLLATFAATALAAGADLSRSRASENGDFLVSVAERPDPVPLNELHAWTVRVETADGEAVEGATIEIDGGMPMHDHGLPTAPRVTAVLGGGNYLLEGMKFQMPGRWTVRLTIVSDELSDTVTFELML